MFLHILTKSLRHRWSRILIAALSVTMGASLAAAALSVSVGMEEKVGRTLRAYGANIMLVPKSAETWQVLETCQVCLKESDLVHLQHVASSLLGDAPFLYAVVESKGQLQSLPAIARCQRLHAASDCTLPAIAALAGTQFDAATRVNPWWKIEGNAPANDDRASAIVGVNVADQWRVKIGDEIAVAAAGASGGYRATQTRFRVTGTLNTGGAEDDQIFVSLAAAQELTHRPGQVSLVQISALGTQTPIQETARTLEQMIPDAQVKTVQQIAQGEVALIRRVQ